MATLKPAAILKKYFEYKEGQTAQEFIAEVKELKADPEAYKELTLLAAEKLGIEPDFN